MSVKSTVARIRSTSGTARALAAEEGVDICGELCGVLEEEAVCGVGVDLDFGLRNRALG
jgi:hypothetical protein